MTKKTRLIILLACFALFLLITPYTIMYSLGYRIDFENRKIVATGGIYVRALPQSNTITIDDDITGKPNIFTNAFFVQDLLPKEYNVLIAKDGYHSYQKRLTVKQNEVSKIEYVILFKKDIVFNPVSETANFFSTSPDNTNLLIWHKQDPNNTLEVINLPTNQRKYAALENITGNITEALWSADSNKVLLNAEGKYFIADVSGQQITPLPVLAMQGATQPLFNPQNSNEIFFIKNGDIYTTANPLPNIANAVDYVIDNQNIMWLATDGFLYNSNISGTTKSKITAEPLTTQSEADYKLSLISGYILLQQNNDLFLLNGDPNIFTSFYGPVKDIKVSPNGRKILYFNDHEVLFSELNGQSPANIFINRFSETISDAYWINDDYFIFEMENKIIISELISEGSLNTAQLPTELVLSTGDTLPIADPEIFFNQQDKKLYILMGDQVVASERLVP